MSGQQDQVAAQLLEELGDPARALGEVLGTDLLLLITGRLETRAWVLADGLCSEDDRLAAEAVRTVMAVLWPHGRPEDTDPSWWRTPVGRMVARSVGHDSTDAVTRHVAAAILGVTPGTVAQLTHRGTLDRHPDGGLTRASVLARADRLGRARHDPAGGSPASTAPTE